MAIVTGPLGIHNVVDSYTQSKFKYLTIPEMCLLYPFLVPLTNEARSFREPLADVRKRVSERFEIEPTEEAFNDIIFKS